MVTGCSSGIGRATALLLARRGFRVVGTVRGASDGAALEADAAAVGVGGSVRAATVDVTDEAQVGQFSEYVRGLLSEHGGRLAGLVNNAGIVVAGAIEETPVARLREVLEVNAVGATAVTQALLPALRAGRGRVVNVSSVSGRIAAPFLGLYAASKFALEALSDALRVEVRPWGIAVVLVEPGPVATPIWAKGERQAFADRDGLPDSPYAAAVPAVRAAFRRAARGGAPPERIAETIHLALTARRPKSRYLVARNPLAFALLHRLAPDGWRDALLARGVGWTADGGGRKAGGEGGGVEGRGVGGDE